MGLKSIGSNIYGNTAYLEEVAANWWLKYRELMAHIYPDISLKVVQAKGGASASAGTHSDGWAVDLQSWHLTSAQISAVVAISRAYGGVAWYRTKSQGFDPHIHIAIDSGGTPWTACQYQVAAAHQGYSGLGRGGRGSRDTHPAPSGGWVTARQGMSLMQNAINKAKERENPFMAAKLDQTVLNQIAAVVDNNVLQASAGAYGTVYKMLRDTADSVRLLTQRTADIRRNGPVSMLQDIADTGTMVRSLETRITAVEAKLDRVIEALDK